MHAEGPWTYSKQVGAPGHCFQAQVWGADGHSLAVIEPTPDVTVASATARIMSLAPDAIVELERVTGLLDTWAKDHPTERTSEIDAALHCARQVLAKVPG